MAGQTIIVPLSELTADTPKAEPHIGADVVTVPIDELDTKPKATIQAPADNEPVTLGDLLDNPKAAIGRIGHLLKNDLSDPETWAAIGAAYLLPKMIEGAPGMTGRATQAMGRTAGKIGGKLDNPVVGAISPRARNIAESMRNLSKVIEPKGKP